MDPKRTKIKLSGWGGGCQDFFFGGGVGKGKRRSLVLILKSLVSACVCKVFVQVVAATKKKPQTRGFVVLGLGDESS